VQDAGAGADKRIEARFGHQIDDGVTHQGPGIDVSVRPGAAAGGAVGIAKNEAAAATRAWAGDASQAAGAKAAFQFKPEMRSILVAQSGESGDFGTRFEARFEGPPAVLGVEVSHLVRADVEGPIPAFFRPRSAGGADRCHRGSSQESCLHSRDPFLALLRRPSWPGSDYTHS
jgi:hypothetical protein